MIMVVAEILALGNNDGITGNATSICASSDALKTFTYNCDKVTGSCRAESDCCAVSASDQCFSTILSSSLKATQEEDMRIYQTNRTVLSFSPGIIRQHHHAKLL